jgi:hypothetical protein
MINRRVALGLIALAGSLIGTSRVVMAKEKEKHHLNGKALLGDKIHTNGRHKLHTAGKVDVFADVNNGKVTGVSAAGMQVKKVRTRQKLAQSTPEVMLASMELAQVETYYYGYWVYDPYGDYFYWFPADLVIVDTTWVDYAA